MAESSLKSSAIKGMFWSAVDKFSVQAGQLVISIILARILMPEDFGLIGMISIFIAISEAFVLSGMGSGLIQKNKCSEVDFSTVFVFNLVISITFYSILFVSAPLIANFYDVPQLSKITRVLSFNVVINALAIVQRSRLTINLDFKAIAKANVISVIVGGLVAIFFAIRGLGVWALVIQNLVRSLVSVFVLWVISKWKPSLAFSQESFRNLFGFGSKLLIQGFIGTLMQNVYNIIIGKYYSAGDLGYYSRAKGFAEITAGTVSGIIHQVTFPILSSIHEDKKRMISVFRRLIKMTFFFICPAMTLLALLADPFVRVLLTEKWLPAVVLLQWMSFARIFYPISVINMNILNAMGRSDLFLKVDLSKTPITIAALIITVPLGVKAMVIGHVVSSFIAFFFNGYLPGKLLGYGPFKQLRDMLPVMLTTAGMAILVYLSTHFLDNQLLKLIVGICTGLISYILIAYLLNIKEIKELKAIIFKE